MTGKKRRRKLLLWAGCILLTTASFLCAQSPTQGGDAMQEALKFARIYQAVAQNYMSPVDPDNVVLEGAIRGMLASLDPFSTFFDRDQFKMLEQEDSGEALGFGSILSVQPGKAMIIQTQQGSPSWRAGLGPGDQIVAVNSVQLGDLGVRQLVALLEKTRSHPAHLSVLRPGDLQPQDFTLTPAQVALPTVDIAFLYSSGIGYIHVASFESKTPQEVLSALQKLGGNNLKGLILDLRNNPGGALDSAVEVCSLFLKPGTLVLTMRGRAVPEKTYRTAAAPMLLRTPVIVMVNGRTVSAAELVTAALQDHDRAIVAGEPTFGKGVVESVMPLNDQTALGLVTAEYFTPSGRSIQKPLAGTALQNPSSGLEAGDASARSPKFHTDDGRPLAAHGGVIPDVRIAALPLDPWLTFLNRAGLLSSFASDYFTYHGKISRDFEPTQETLEEFRNFLAAQRIQSPERYWSEDQEYLIKGIKAALFNLAFGLDAGNEIATRNDLQVEKAASLFPRVPALLKGESVSPFLQRPRASLRQGRMPA
ncbi:MAG: S41 family peptidase, partial [Terriglobia bacterium]